MIAYLVLVRRYPEEFKRLFRAIHDPANVYLVDLDRNSGPVLEADIRAFLAAYPNSEVLDAKGVLWGYSRVEAELRGMTRLLAMGANWRFFINLSGQDFPLKTQGQIASDLSANAGSEFIRVLDVEHIDRIDRTLIARPFLAGARPYIGAQWKVVSRRLCEFVRHDPEADRYKDFYRNTFIADEAFFQTVMMNTSAHGKIVNDDLRTIDWAPDGGGKLRPRTFTVEDAGRLLTDKNLFARKFDASVDDEILGVLERFLLGQDCDVPLAPTLAQVA
jgi:hypothetical protein